MESAIKPRSESPRSHNLRVRFKHPIEEDATAYIRPTSIEELGLIDPLIQLHAKEIIAAKLLEGFYIKGNGEKCRCCHMPLMVKDTPWDGMFCGQSWYQSQKAGVCVVCPEPNEEEEESNASSQEYEINKQYRNWIPSFPEDDAYDVEEEMSRDSHDGSIGEFKKKFAITSDVHVKKIEMNTEVDEICAKELKKSAVTNPDGSRNCPSCGMEMLSFGEDFECPFCALEMIKEEMGIAGMDMGGDETPIIKRRCKKNQVDHDMVEGIYLSDLMTASSSCSTLSEGIRFMEADPANQCQRPKQVDCIPVGELPLVKSASEAGSTMIAINAVLNSLRDAHDQEPASPAPKKSSPISDKSEKVGDEQALSEAGSTQLAVNDVLKRLITGFWKENNEKISQDSEVKLDDPKPANDEACISPEAENMEEDKPDNNEDDEVSINQTKVGQIEEETPINDGKSNSEALVYRGKSFNDDLHDKVKALAAIVFGIKEEKVEMYKSNEIKGSFLDVMQDENSFHAPSQEVMRVEQEDTNGEESILSNSESSIEQNEDVGASNKSEVQEEDARSNKLPRAESSLFEEDMSTDDIFIALNEIEAVTKNILDLPVFHDSSPDVFSQVMSVDDFERHCEEEVRRSTIDPPSVCSRASRNSRDPPNPTTITYEPIDEDLLLPQKDNLPMPDCRDPPTTIVDMYQPKLEFNFSETILVPERQPRDPSEHGGSLELDSFSLQDDDEDHNQEFHAKVVSECVINEDQEHIPTLISPPEEVATYSYREPVEPVGASSFRLFQKPPILKYLKQPDVTAVADVKSRWREPIEPKSTVPTTPYVNKIVPLQAKDLYQPPEFLKTLTNEPESSRDEMIRNRLMQLESRYQKLMSPCSETTNAESYTAIDKKLELRYQKLTSQCVDASSDDLTPKLQSIFRENRFTFDNVDLHQTTSLSSLGINAGSGLSPHAVARRAHYKKQLFAAEKNCIQAQCSNDSGPCLSPSAVQRRQHYKEVLREQLARQGSQLVTQE